MNRKCKKCGFIHDTSNMRFSKVFKGWVCFDVKQCLDALLGRKEGEDLTMKVRRTDYSCFRCWNLSCLQSCLDSELCKKASEKKSKRE